MSTDMLFAQLLLVLLESLAPFIGAIFGGAVAAALLQAMLRIEDRSISFVGKGAALGAVLYLFLASSGSKVLEFAADMWGNAASYY